MTLEMLMIGIMIILVAGLGYNMFMTMILMCHDKPIKKNLILALIFFALLWCIGPWHQKQLHKTRAVEQIQNRGVTE